MRFPLMLGVSTATVGYAQGGATSSDAMRGDKMNGDKMDKKSSDKMGVIERAQTAPERGQFDA